jgi:hypothetical protein
MGDIGGLQ